MILKTFSLCNLLIPFLNCQICLSFPLYSAKFGHISWFEAYKYLHRLVGSWLVHRKLVGSHLSSLFPPHTLFLPLLDPFYQPFSLSLQLPSILSKLKARRISLPSLLKFGVKSHYMLQ